MRQKLLNKVWLQVSLLVAVMSFAFAGTAWGQTIIYSESFGDNGSSNTVYSSCSSYSATSSMFVGTGTVASHYSGSGKVGKNNVSPSDYTGASGLSAAWYTGSKNSTADALIISGININGYEDLSLSFGINMTNGASTTNTTTVSYKIDNGDFQTLSFTHPTSSGWSVKSGSITGTGSSLTIKFSMATAGGYTTRYDDIKVTGTSSSSSSAVSTTTAISVPNGFITDLAGNSNVAAGTLSATVTPTGGTALSNPSITWSSTEESVATISANGAVTLKAVGTTTITATYAGDGTNYNGSSDTYVLSVIDSYAKGGMNNPYTVAEAIAATPTSGNVYIQGVVSSFYNTSIVGDGTNYRYYISDDGTTTTQLLVFKGKGLNQATFTNADDLKVGDEVIIYGSLITYQNAPEVASGNYLYSWNRPAVTTPSITISTETLSGFTYEEGNGPSTAKTFTVSGENLTANIGLSLSGSDFEMSLLENSDYTNSLTLTQESGEVAETTVYVRLKSDLSENSYSGTITLSSSNASNVAISLSGSVTAPEAANVAWNLNVDETATATTTEMTWTSSYATMAVAKGSATTNTNNYYPGTNNYTSTRFYKNSMLTITPASGYSISSVVFTATSDNYANSLANSTWNNATATANGTTVTVTPTNGASALSATIGGTCGFTLVKVYYEVDTTPIIESENQSITYEVTSGSIDYTITNEGNGSLTASVPSGSWLTIETITSSKVQFSCAANVGAERSTTVTLTYTYDTNKTVTKDVIVTQAGKPYSVSWTAGENTELFIFAGDESEAIKNGDGVVVGTTVMVSIDVTSGYTGTLTVKDANNDDVSLTEITEGSYYSFVMPASNVTITSAAEKVQDKTYVLATTITSGKHYVIASGTSDEVKVMSTIQNSNNRGVADGSVSGTILNVKSDAGAAEVVIYGPDADGLYTIYDSNNGGYLYANSSNNYLRTQVTNNANGLWSISIDGTNSAARVSVDFSGTERIMRYNSNNNIFSCYTSGQQDIYLYEKANEATPTETKTLNGSGYATYCSQNALDFTNNTDVTAWIVTAANSSTGVVTFSQITGKAPAGTGMLLKGGKSAEVTLTSANGMDDLNGNLLIGTISEFEVINNGDYYGLSGNTFVPVNAGTVPAGKALLPASKVGSAARLSFVFEGDDTTTGISTMHNSEFIMHNEVYNLNGQRVNDMKKGGLYIMNGKKVIVK